MMPIRNAPWAALGCVALVLGCVSCGTTTTGTDTPGASASNDEPPASFLDVTSSSGAGGSGETTTRTTSFGEVAERKGTVRLTFRAEVLFDFDKSELKPSAEEALVAALAQEIAVRPTARVFVEGHTDDVGADDYNLGLSNRRATAVSRWLERHEVAAARIATKGYGERWPRVANTNDATRASNRRVEIVLADGGPTTPCAAQPAASGAPTPVSYHYVDWTDADVAGGTASGTITLADGSTVKIAFAAINQDGSAGKLFGAQVVEGGTRYWQPATPYVSAEVPNGPPGTDLLQLKGGLASTYRITLSEPIKDPLMAIVSLGSGSIPASYDFDSPFAIVSQGGGYWGGGPTALVARPGDVLEGHEGHGTIRFLGTYAKFSWTVPTPEEWHGFTFAIRTTERLEPGTPPCNAP